jgi:hypothetical protein
MKAVRVTAQADGSMAIAPLPLPATQRQGEASADNYRRQATGEKPTGSHFGAQASDMLRTILLSDGVFKELASQAGPLLSFVVSGDVTLRAGPSQSVALEPGDMFLADGQSASKVTLDVRNDGRLIQIPVAPEWPGPDAEIQRSGTVLPRQGPSPSIKRIIKGAGDDEKAYFVDFPELFPKTPDQWSSPRPITGFRMLCWEDGSMDYHPCVVNQMAIVGSGEIEIEVRGNGVRKERFRAGDVTLAEDRTGEGHLNRVHGIFHTTSFVLGADYVWAQE